MKEILDEFEEVRAALQDAPHRYTTAGAVEIAAQLMIVKALKEIKNELYIARSSTEFQLLK